MALTITEGLAELGTITKRIAKKREFVTAYLFRQDTLRDPLVDQGGSAAAIAAERQAITDLTERMVRIRAAIAASNATTKITINGTERSVADWITWRRDVSPGLVGFHNGLKAALANVRKQAIAQQVHVRGVEQPANQNNDVIVNIDEKALADTIESLEIILGTLDGQLSLKNATTVIEV